MSNEQLTNEQINLIQMQVNEIMADIDPSKGRLIQIKQGARSKLKDNSLLVGEPCYITDDKVLVIGTGTGYIEFPNIEAMNNYEVKDGSITEAKLSQALKDVLADLEASKVIINDTLTSDSNTEALSAKQGKELKRLIDAIEQNQTVLNVIDNLNSTSSTDALSANQGKILDDKIKNLEQNQVNITVVDNLTSTSTTDALSVNQGKVLNDKIQNIIDNPVGTTVNDTLTSESTTEALSANQGKVLNDNQVAHAEKRASSSAIGHVYSWEQGINIPTSLWQGTSAPYSATVNLTPMRSIDNPFILPMYTNDYTIALAEREAYSKIDEVKTRNGSIEFKCFDSKPETQITVLVKVVI